MRFRIIGVEVLKKRPNANKPCNESLLDDDSQWRNTVMDIVGCIPDFWKKFHNHDGGLPNCTRMQYLEIDTQYSPNRNFEDVAKLYMDPCKQMNAAVTTTSSLEARTDSRFRFRLIFQHATEEFKATVNNEAFNAETLCSQIGGFVGNLSN